MRCVVCVQSSDVSRRTALFSVLLREERGIALSERNKPADVVRTPGFANTAPKGQGERMSDGLPGYTCPQIDAMKRKVRKVMSLIDHPTTPFSAVSRMQEVLEGLEELRGANHQLREGYARACDERDEAIKERDRAGASLAYIYRAAQERGW